MRRSSRGLLALCMLGAAVTAAFAAAPDLSDFERVLPLLQPAERSRLQQRALTWRQWSPHERAAHAARTAAWDALPAAERGERRERYLAWRALPTAERTRILHARDAFATLDPARREVLRAQFAALDGSERRGWRLGPSLGADYPALQPLLAQVPSDQHEPLLRVLRAMEPRQRIDLAALAQRTPPNEREALRRELLSTSAANREAWLQDRLMR
ncbi:DUF3106 domain-containing protein [Lysobacter korlensis]|uniref:DUF3106 domain-containing protein n=1 Tax=Lysobacter korlensis TaxID=553636 RepID=A0ABV6RIL0_9GAMM